MDLGRFLPFVKGVPEGGGIYLSRYQKEQLTTLRPLNPPPAFASLWRGTSFTKGGKRHIIGSLSHFLPLPKGENGLRFAGTPFTKGRKRYYLFTQIL
jgi:hypothetical protein